jgi:hypothetical protein
MATTTVEVTKCSVDGCNKAAVVKGLCQNHYRRLLAYGDPLASKRAFYGVPTKVVALTVPEVLADAIVAEGKRVGPFITQMLCESKWGKATLEANGVELSPNAFSNIDAVEEQAEKKPRKKKKADAAA